MLGKAGEEFVFELERKRLSMLGRQDLADDVRWVARDDGDGYGYDILSFHGSGTGYEASRERWLEIKTTNGPKTTPFFITRNELNVSRGKPEDLQGREVIRFPEKSASIPPGTAAGRSCSAYPCDLQGLPLNPACFLLITSTFGLT